MPEKKRKRNMIKEVTAIAKVGLLVSIPVVTTMMFVKIVYKQMSIHWTYIYLVEATVIVMGGYEYYHDNYAIYCRKNV